MNIWAGESIKVTTQKKIKKHIQRVIGVEMHLTRPGTIAPSVWTSALRAGGVNCLGEL